MADKNKENYFALSVKVKKLLDKANYKGSITSGIRTEEEHLDIYDKKGIKDKSQIPMNSKHLSGQAQDIADPKGELAAWIMKNQQELNNEGLYIEDPGTTGGWIHFQDVQPKSGKRVFIPNKTFAEQLKGKLNEVKPENGMLPRAQIQPKKKTEPLTRDEAMSLLVKPFRDYHLVTSWGDIISNSIGVSSKEMSNSVQVAHPVSSGKSNYDGTEGFNGYVLTDKLMADDDIDPRFIKNKVYTFHNAHQTEVKDLPMRYAKSLLVKNIEKGYDGKLVILGRPGIKPHDVIFLYDIYADVIGPIGVRRVVHIYDTSRGFITEITPKMMVFPDNSVGALQLNALKKVAAGFAINQGELFYTDMERFCPADYSTDHEQNIRDKGGALKAINNEYKRRQGASMNESSDVDVGAATGEIAIKAGVMTMAAGASKLIPGKLAVDAEILGKALSKTGEEFTKMMSEAKLANSHFVGSTTQRASVIGSAVRENLGYAVKGSTFIAKKGLKVGAKVAGRFAGPLSLILMDSVIEGIVNWTKYRQPILFHPLTRKGNPWYGGLKGFKDNTLLDSFSMKVKEWQNRAEYVGLLFNMHYERIIGKK